MNILFWLYKSRMNKKGLAPIMMRISLDGKRINFPTQIEVEETQWDKDRQRVKGSNDLVKAYNKQLLILNTNAWNYYNDCIRQQIPYLLDNGMSRQEYEWFFNYTIKKHCIMGNDYYSTNEHMVHEDGSSSPSGEIFGYHSITHQYFSRYRLPVMHTETNFAEPDSVMWLKKQWANVHRLKQDGVSLVGFTWYSLIDQVDWDTSLREDNNNINKLGLFDIDRKIRPVGEAYKMLISKWKPVLTSECFGLHIYNF